MGSTPRNRSFIDVRLLTCFLLAVSDAALLLDFPGSYTCLHDGIQVSKPDTIILSSWKSLHIVDAIGSKIEACDFHTNKSNITIPETCIRYEAGKKLAYVAFTQPAENLVYKIACPDYQADSDNQDLDGPIFHCGKDFIMANISRTLAGFSDESVALEPISTWMLVIHNGTKKLKVNTTSAKTYGYTLTSDAYNFVIQIAYGALGINELLASDTKFYQGYIELLLEKKNPRIHLELEIICAKGPFQCNDTYMTIFIPPFNGVLEAINTNNISISMPSSDAELQKYGLTVDTSGGTKIAIKKEALQVLPNTDKVYSLPYVLIFLMNDARAAMKLVGECLSQQVSSTFVCTKDGFIDVSVLSLQTNPHLNLSKVILGDGQCKPLTFTGNSVTFRFYVNDCGTKMKIVDGEILYENDLHALWKDYPRRISRDSELRLTIRCQYKASDVASFNMKVLTPAPPVSESHTGQIVFELNLYPDDSYAVQYQDNQYPVVKTLRDPIYLEVQVRNRGDPNIELVLKDCWATMSSDPNSSPQWNIVLDGCEEGKDNYLTVFHEVTNVALPKHRKRFEVKTFAFIQGGGVSANLVYFHCTALICNTASPDYPLCTKRCPGARRKRDELFLNRHSMLASLPGPLLFVDSDPAMTLEDEDSVIEQITLEVLPAFGIVAVIILVVVLVSTVKRKAKH